MGDAEVVGPEEKQVKKMNPEVSRRRGLMKFAYAMPSDISTDEIILERPRADGQSAKQEENEFVRSTIIICRSCGKKGDHWASKCPYKGLGLDKENVARAGAPGKSGAYVAPGLRSGDLKREGDNNTRDYNNSIRVTNLSENAREQDLHDLFRPFGTISRIYAPFDRETGLNRGFAFVNFVSRDDAVKAIKKLDGYGYDNLILRVEWAKDLQF